MANLISNGSRLYRYNSQLLRTPLIINLNLIPAEAAQFDCGNVYKQDICTAGFVGGQAASEIDAVGKQMRKVFCGFENPKGSWIWRKNGAFPNLDPGFIFYQGAYSTSRGEIGAEAYMTFPAYHFTIPEEYDKFEVVNANVSLMHGGCILQYMSALQKQTNLNRYPVFAKDAATWLLDSNSPWRGTMESYTGFFPELYDPMEMANDATDVFDAEMNNAVGDLNLGSANAKPYWISWSGVNYADGFIPVSSNPWQQQFQLSQAACQTMTQYRAGWIPSIPWVDVTTGTANNPSIDNPYYPASSDSRAAGFWLCTNWWGFYLHITLALA